MSHMHCFTSSLTRALNEAYNLKEITENNDKWEEFALGIRKTGNLTPLTQYVKTKYNDLIKNSDSISHETLQGKRVFFLKLLNEGIKEKNDKKQRSWLPTVQLKDQIDEAKQLLTQINKDYEAFFEPQEIDPETIMSDKGKEKVDETPSPKAKNKNLNIPVASIKEGFLLTKGGKTFLIAYDKTQYLLPSLGNSEDSSAKTKGSYKTYIGKGERQRKNKNGQLEVKNKEVAVLVMNNRS